MKYLLPEPEWVLVGVTFVFPWQQEQLGNCKSSYTSAFCVHSVSLKRSKKSNRLQRTFFMYLFFFFFWYKVYLKPHCRTFQTTCFIYQAEMLHCVALNVFIFGPITVNGSEHICVCVHFKIRLLPMSCCIWCIYSERLLIQCPVRLRRKDVS